MAKLFDTVRLHEIRERKRKINEELGREQRYTVTMEYYVYAKNDKEAVVLARQEAGNQKEKLDNEAVITSVHATPFGFTSNPKQIYP